MDIELKEAAFQGQNIIIRTHGIFHGTQLLLNGAPAPKEKGSYILTDNTDKTVHVKIKSRFYDPVPELDIDGTKIKLAENLKWYEYAWMATPVVILIFAGGGLGAFFGAIALIASASLFRTKINGFLKYFVSLLYSAAGWAAFYFFVLLIGISWVRAPQWHTENFKDFGFSIESPYELSDTNEAMDKDAFDAQLSKRNNEKLPSSCTVIVESFVINKKLKVTPDQLAGIAMDEYKNDATYGDVEINTKTVRHEGLDAVMATGSFKLMHVFLFDFKHIFVTEGSKIWHVSVDYAGGKPELEKTGQRVIDSLKIAKN